MHYILPICGEAQRFQDVGYKLPKPMIRAGNKTIIELALESLDLQPNDKLSFIARYDHVSTFAIDSFLKKKFGHLCEVDITILDRKTGGAAETCALINFDPEKPICIFTPDVHIFPSYKPVIGYSDGYVISFLSNAANHSYIKGNPATEIVEKRVISENALAGIYYFEKGKYFLKGYDYIVRNKITYNNELYISSTYEWMIKKGLTVKHSPKNIYTLGTPKALEFYNKYIYKSNNCIGLCSDHSGYEDKKNMIEELKYQNIPYIDFGCFYLKACDYADYVNESCKALREGICSRIFGFCRSGEGMNIAANKQKDIIAALIYDTESARLSVEHNCANFFSIRSGLELPLVLNNILNSKFQGGRHTTRLMKAINDSVA